MIRFLLPPRMRLRRFFFSALVAGALSSSWAFGATTDATVSTEPVITAVRGRNVTVSVPAGFDRVVLQALRPARQRQLARKDGDDAAKWKTIATKYPHREARALTFHLPRLTPKRHLRVLGNQDEILPGSFFTGFTNFLGDPPIAADAFTLSNAFPGAVNSAADPDTITLVSKTNEGGDATRAVVEADIWKVVGDRLYFYNQLRGLQLFDLSDPNEPLLVGTVRMPAAGEDLYVLPSGDAVLLKQGSYDLWEPWSWPTPVVGRVSLLATSSDLRALLNGELFVPNIPRPSTSEVVTVSVREGKPVVAARVPFDGTLRESRMVGEILYVASEVNETDPNGVLPSSHCRLTSFDLHDPAHPVRRESIDLAGWPTAVTASDQFFFVARWDAAPSNNAFGNIIEIIDISAPDGSMKRGGAAKVKGNIADKFKMHHDGATLTAISSSWRYENADGKVLPGWAPNARWVPFTTVDTFSIENANTPVALDSLEIAPGETVRGTRFDNGRVYVVTFVQIDPLWIVDLTVPEHLKVLGHVEAPGFSTYIEPLGDRLVTIGLVRNEPAVSLFDVSDAAHPALLKQVTLGNETNASGWVWSDAVWDEKAFRVLPDEKLILLPLSSYNYPSGSAGRVQLIDLLRNDLVKRGVIEAEFFPRRATVHRDRVVSIAPTKLVTVDATDRDHPVVQSEIEIAWSTTRLFVVREHLIEIGDTTFHGDPRLTITPTNDPEATLATKDLTLSYPIVGATVRDDVLYIAQMRNPWELAAGGAIDGAPRGRLHLSTFDVSALPGIRALGSASMELRTSYGWGGLPVLEPLWPNPATLVWSAEGAAKSWAVPTGSPVYSTSGFTGGATAVNSVSALATESVGALFVGRPLWSPRYYGHSRVLHAFDVAVPQQPKGLSTVEVGKDEPWDVSRAFAGDGAIYLSHKWMGNLDSFSPDADKDEQENDVNKNLNRHFLDVIRFDDPAHPQTDMAHPNLPGRLVGLSRQGRLLYTMGRQYDLTTRKSSGTAAA
jgi:hypothetical protein